MCISWIACELRKFFDALPGGKIKGISGEVIVLIRELYAIEKRLKDLKALPSDIGIQRKKHAIPVLEKIKMILEKTQPQAPPSSPLGNAIHYTLKRWGYLTNYVQDGRYEIDNNRSERAVKPFVTGRKNWLFSNTSNGAHASARLFRLITFLWSILFLPILFDCTFLSLQFCEKTGWC